MTAGTRAGSQQRSLGAIDFSHLSRYTAGDDGVMRDVLTIFRSQARDWVEALDKDLPDERWHDLAHALKGSARGIGAFEIARIAEAAEGLMGENSTGAREALLNHLNAELSRVLNEIDLTLD